MFFTRSINMVYANSSLTNFFKKSFLFEGNGTEKDRKRGEQGGGETEREKQLSSAGSVSKCPYQLWLGKPKSGVRNCPGVPRQWREPKHLSPIICRLPKWVRRKWNQKCRSQNSKMLSHMGGRCPKQWFNLLHHICPLVYFILSVILNQCENISIASVSVFRLFCSFVFSVYKVQVLMLHLFIKRKWDFCFT